MREGIALFQPTEQDPIVCRALEFAANLLRYSDTFYPFGLLSINGDIQNVFTQQSPDNEAQGGMIEELEWLSLERGFKLKRACSVIVYVATVETVGEDTLDVIVTKFTTPSGTEIIRLHPYHFSANRVSIEKPFAL